MSTPPRVTVVIPTHDCGRFVRDAVESALGQIGTTVEVVVVDDGSTDDTRTVLTPYRNRLRYLHQENAGPASARNRGLRSTRGEYVFFLDADDSLLPDTLAAHAAFLDAHPSVGVAPSGWRTVTESGEHIRDFAPWRDRPRLDVKAWLLSSPALFGAMLFRRAWLERVAGPFDETLQRSEDIDLLLRLGLAGCPMAWFEAMTLNYRQRAASITHDPALTEAYADTVLDKFFAIEGLPGSIRSLEGKARFNRLVWVAWTLRDGRSPAKVAAYLRRALEVSPYDPQTTVLMWSNAFATMSPHELSRDEWQILLGAMQIAAPEHVAPWVRSSAALEWWMRVWGHYVDGDRPAGDRGLIGFRSAPPSELVALARMSLMMTPADEMLNVIAWLWAGACAAGMVPDPERSAVAGLYLTAFGQAALGGQRSVAVRALWHALRASSGPPAIRAWLGFLRNAASYAADTIVTPTRRAQARAGSGAKQ